LGGVSDTISLGLVARSALSVTLAVIEVPALPVGIPLIACFMPSVETVGLAGQFAMHESASLLENVP
jgi:hypothetical protein